MAMTEKEKQELKAGMKQRLEEHKKKNKSKRRGCLATIVVVIVLGIAYCSSGHDKQQATQIDTTSPSIHKLSVKDATNKINALISSKEEYIGSLRDYKLSEFHGKERAKVKKYKDKWVSYSREAAIIALTNGVCKHIESVDVFRYSKNPYNPELSIECDNSEFQGLYSDFKNNVFLDANTYQKRKADAYYASAPDAGNSERQCHDALKTMLKNPETLDLYPTTAKEDVRAGKNGPEFIFSEKFTSEGDISGLKIKNTFFCTVTSDGKIKMQLAHQ